MISDVKVLLRSDKLTSQSSFFSLSAKGELLVYDQCRAPLDVIFLHVRKVRYLLSFQNVILMELTYLIRNEQVYNALLFVERIHRPERLYRPSSSHHDLLRSARMHLHKFSDVIDTVFIGYPNSILGSPVFLHFRAPVRWHELPGLMHSHFTFRFVAQVQRIELGLKLIEDNAATNGAYGSCCQKLSRPTSKQVEKLMHSVLIYL